MSEFKNKTYVPVAGLVETPKLKFRDKKLGNIYWLKYVTSETISRGRKLLSASAPNLIQTVWFLKIIG